MIVNPIISGGAKEIKHCYLQGLMGPGNRAQIPIIFEDGMTWQDYLDSPYYIECPAVTDSEQPGTLLGYSYCLRVDSIGRVWYQGSHMDVSDGLGGYIAKVNDLIVGGEVYEFYFS